LSLTKGMLLDLQDTQNVGEIVNLIL